MKTKIQKRYILSHETNAKIIRYFVGIFKTTRVTRYLICIFIDQIRIHLL